MEDKIKEAIEQARRAKPGIIIPMEDIYNAIYKAGERTVAEWVEKHSHQMNTNMYGISLGREEWQAFKKGLDKEVKE